MSYVVMVIGLLRLLQGKSKLIAKQGNFVLTKNESIATTKHTEHLLQCSSIFQQNLGVIAECLIYHQLKENNKQNRANF